MKKNYSSVGLPRGLPVLHCGARVELEFVLFRRCVIRFRYHEKVARVNELMWVHHQNHFYRECQN